PVESRIRFFEGVSSRAGGGRAGPQAGPPPPRGHPLGPRGDLASPGTNWYSIIVRGSRCGPPMPIAGRLAVRSELSASIQRVPRTMRVLSGIQPSGALHIGNYFGALRQFIDLQRENEAYYFVANYHALTSVRDAEQLRSYTFDVSVTMLSLGLDPERATLFVQS